MLAQWLSNYINNVILFNSQFNLTLTLTPWRVIMIIGVFELNLYIIIGIMQKETEVQIWGNWGKQGKHIDQPSTQSV